MKHLIPLIILAAILLPACKPNENAYRAAYESAVKKRDTDSITGGKIEGTVYNRFRDMANITPIPLGNDTLQVVTEYIGFTDDGGASRESVLTYNVVVGRFKQIFNARQMRQRLQDNGYPDAFIIHTREPLYYVVTATESTAQGALEQLRKVEADPSLLLKAPLPFILRPAHLKR